MSRIAGVVAERPMEESARAVRAMLACHYHEESSSRIVECGSCAAGWVGIGTENASHMNRLVAAIDGHLYNADDCLNGKGLLSDVIMKLYAKHGFEEAVKKLNGEFAIALYDGDADTLWLARDRLGVKPLYFLVQPTRCIFASQPGQLLRVDGVRSEPNKKFVGLFAGSHYRYFDNDPDKSPYEGIWQVPASHIVRITNGGVTKSRYWTLEDLPDFEESEGVLAQRLRLLMEDSISLRLNHAIEPGFSLSGGMDSSSVLALAARVLGEKQHAFSTVYDDKTYDESQEIQPMLGAAVREWHPVRVDPPDILRLVERMVVTHNEPVATATWLSHYVMCEEIARRGFQSVFGGLGGDELHAGEYEYYLYHFADLRAGGQSGVLEREIDRWISHHDHPIFRKSQASAEEGLARLTDKDKQGRCLPDARRLRRYASAVNRDFFDVQAFEPRMDHPFKSYLKNRIYQDLFFETLPCSLRAEDRQATAFGLDHFPPMCDYRLVEFMFRIPGHMKIRHGITKHLLRIAMNGVLPDETRLRIKKTGWNAPAHVWFVRQGREAVWDIIRSRTFRERGIYSCAEVERLVLEHEEIIASGTLVENHMMFIWQLVNLELWLRSLSPK